MPGLHNALNAPARSGCSSGWGTRPARPWRRSPGFEGTQRRFEFKGQVRGVRVYDDFAHHPTEIAAALTAARGVVGAGRLLPIFQPHLYSRTRLLAADFARTFETLADHTTVVPIYGARQDPEPGVTGQLITERFEDAEPRPLPGRSGNRPPGTPHPSPGTATSCSPWAAGTSTGSCRMCCARSRSAPGRAGLTERR